MENITSPQVTIWFKEEYQDVDVSFTYKGGIHLAFNDYIDACRRAALAFGYNENLVRNFFEKQF